MFQRVRDNATVCAHAVCAIQVLMDKGILTQEDLQAVRDKHAANAAEEPRGPETGSQDPESNSQDADEPGLASEGDTR